MSDSDLLCPTENTLCCLARICWDWEGVIYILNRFFHWSINFRNNFHLNLGHGQFYWGDKCFNFIIIKFKDNYLDFHPSLFALVIDYRTLPWQIALFHIIIIMRYCVQKDWLWNQSVTKLFSLVTYSFNGCVTIYLLSIPGFTWI